MGNVCNSDSSSKGDLGMQKAGKDRIGDDPTLVLPDFDEMRSLINKKAGDMDLDITRSQRDSASEDRSLILPACRGVSPTLLIKYYLVYNFYIDKYGDKNSNKKQFQQLFYELLEKSSNEPAEKQLIEQLKAEVQKESNQARQSLLLINYAFKSQFILESLNKVLLLSKDPKDLSYFIFPIHSLHRGISAAYPKETYYRRKDPIFIVAVLESREIDLLKKMEGNENYFFFSAFMRGFTDEQCAREAMKSINKNNKGKTFLFTVNFPYSPDNLNSAENNGFYICKNPDAEVKKKGDVLFNIMSSFKLEGRDGNECDLIYGELAAKEYMKE
jgi:hypothetical protein